MTALEFPFRDTHDDTLEGEYRSLQGSQELTRVRLPLGGEAWLACSYQHVRQILGDSRFSRAEAERRSLPRFSDAHLPETTLMAMPETRHALVRRAIAPLFTPRRVEERRQHIRELAEQLIGAFLGDELPGDLVPTIQQFTLGCIGILLDLNMATSRQIEQLARGVLDAGVSDEEVWNDRGRSLEDAIANWLTDATSDTKSALGSLAGSGLLTHEELIQFVRSVFLGGVGAPTSFLAGAVHAILTPTDNERYLVSSVHMPALVNELLRYVPTGVTGFTRKAIEDVLVGETLVAAGEIVVPVGVAANRDAGAFDDPDSLDVTRKDQAHLAFGHGAHYCPGAYLSRVEAEEFLTVLARLAPDLRESTVEWAPGPLVRNVACLEVRL